MPAELLSTSHGQTLVLTLRNPEHRNALVPEICAAAVEALGVAETVVEVRSVVITGEGASFCAGTQLQRLLAARRQPPEVAAQELEALHSWIEAIRTFPKPVIAAVEGVAAGAGFSLALACDLVVAADSALFSLGATKVGLSPEGGASWGLAQAVPRQLQAELLMAGERITAGRLHALGLVNTLAATGDALHTALALAERLNARAPHALASTKELMNEAPGSTLNQQLARERNHFVRNLHHPNAGAQMEAFLARQPQREA